jgi:hypothetical protein
MGEPERMARAAARGIPDLSVSPDAERAEAA